MIERAEGQKLLTVAAAALVRLYPMGSPSVYRAESS